MTGVSTELFIFIVILRLVEVESYVVEVYSGIMLEKFVGIVGGNVLEIEKRVIEL